MLRVTVSHDGKDAVYTIVPKFTFAQLRAEACKHFGLRTVDGSSKAPSRRWQLCTQEGSAVPDGDQVPMVSGQKFVLRELSEATTAAVKVVAQMTPPYVPSPSTRLASGARSAAAATPTRPRQPTPSALSAIAASLAATAVSPGTLRRSTSVPDHAGVALRPGVPDSTTTAAAGGSTGRHAQPPHLGVVGRAPSAFLVVAETVKPILSSFLAGPPASVDSGGVGAPVGGSSSMRLTPRTTGLALSAAQGTSAAQTVDFSSDLDASEWLASLSGLPSFLLVRVWRSVSVGCLSLVAQQPAPSVAALPRPITHIPVLPGPTAAFLAVACTDAAASVRVCAVEDVHGLLSFVSSYVPGWPVWPLGAPTPWTPLAALLAVMAHLSTRAAALSQEHALGMSLQSAHGLLDEGSRASLRSLREALSGRILRKATAMLAHIMTRSTPAAPYNLALERVPPANGLSILSPLRFHRSVQHALLPAGCPRVLAQQIHKLTAVLMDAWLTRPADASAASQGHLHTGLVKLASAYSLPSSAGLSFHRLMSLCSDMGWVKTTGLPLHTWMAIFLTHAQREVIGGGVSSGDRGHVGGRASSHRHPPFDGKRRSAGNTGRRSDITVGTVRPWHSDDPLADDPLEEGPEGDGEEEGTTPPVLSSPSAQALQNTGRSATAAGEWTRSTIQRTVQAQRRGQNNDAAVQALLMQTTVPASALSQVVAMVAVVHSLHMLVPLIGSTDAEQKLTLLLDHPALVQQVVATLCSGIQEQGSLGLPIIVKDVMDLLLPPTPSNPIYGQEGKQLTSALRSVAATTLLLPLVLLSLHSLLQLSSSGLVKQRVETLIGSRVWEGAAAPVFSSPTALWGASSTPGLASPHHMTVTGSSNASWPSKLLLESGRLVCTRFFSLRTADQGGVGYPGVDRRRIALVLQRLYSNVDPGPLLLRVAQGLSPPAPSSVSQHIDYLPLLEHSRLAMGRVLHEAHAHAQTAAQGRSDAAAAGRAAALSVSSAGKDPSSSSSRARGVHDSASDGEGDDREGSGAEGSEGEGADHDEDTGSQSTRGSAWNGGDSEEEDAREQEKIGAYLTMKVRARAQHEASNREAAFVLSSKPAGAEKHVGTDEAAASSARRTALPEPIPVVVLSSTDARALRAASENAADVYGMVTRALGYSTGARRGLEHLAMTGTPLSPSVEAFRQAWLGPTSDAEPSEEMNGNGPLPGDGDEEGLAATTVASTLAKQGLSLQSPGAAHVLQQATNSIVDAAYWDGSVGESDVAMCHSLVPPPPPSIAHEKTTKAVPSTGPVVDATLPAEDADTTESETDQLRRVVAAVTGTGLVPATGPATSARARAVDVDPTELSADIELALSSGVDEPRSGRREGGSARAGAGGRGEGSPSRPGPQDRVSSSPPPVAKLHLRDTGLGIHLPAPAVLQSLSASRASVVAAWSTPEGAWSRLSHMITRIEEARAKLEQASTALYVMCSSPFATPTSLGEMQPLPVEDEVSSGKVSGSTAEHPAAFFQTLLQGKIKPLDPVEHSSATPGSFMSATASARAVSGVETALRTSISWGEYHSALLCAAQAQAIMEAVQWKQIMDERALARDMQSLSTSASMKDAGSGQIHPETASSSVSGPVASITHVQLVLPATAVEIESYEEADADQLLARACMHLERALLIRPPPWSAALQLLAQVLLQRATLTFPVYITATAKVATNSSLKLPLPSPPALLQPLSQDSTHGSRVHVAAGRFVHSWFHDRPTAISMLLTAREALRAALQSASGAKAAGIDAGTTAACETLGYQISASLAVQGLLSDCTHAFGGGDAHMFRVIADAAAAKGRPHGGAGSVLDASGGDAEGSGAAKSGTGVAGPVHWGCRLSLPLYAPAYAHATASGHEKKQKVAVLSGAGLLLAWKLFSLLDRDGDGMLTGPELARAWTALGPQIDPTLAAWAREEETDAQPLSMDARLGSLPAEAAAGGLFRHIEEPSARAGVAIARQARLSSISSWLSAHFSAGFAVPRLDPLASSDAVPSQNHSSSPSLSVAVWAVPYATSLDVIRRRLLARASKHSYKAYSYLQQEGFVYQPYLYASGALSFFDLPLAGSAQGFDRTWAVSSSANVYAVGGALPHDVGGPQSHQAPALDEAAGLDGPATLSTLPSCWVGTIARALRISALKRGEDASSAACASRMLRALLARIRRVVAESPPAAANKHADKQPWKHVVHRVPTLTRKSAVCYTSVLGGPTTPASLSPLTAQTASVQLSVAVALGAITGQQGDDMAQAAIASSSSGIHGLQSGVSGGGFTFPAFAEFCAWLACTDPLRLCEPLLKVGLLAPLPATEAYGKAPVSLRSSWRASRRPLLSTSCAAASMCKWLSLPAQLNTPLALLDVLRLKEEEAVGAHVDWPSLHVYLSPCAEGEEDAFVGSPSRVGASSKASALNSVYASLFPTVPTEPLVLQGATKVVPDGGDTGSSDSSSENSSSESGSGTLTVTSDEDPEGRLTGSGSNGPQSEGGRSRSNTGQTPRTRGFSGLSSYARLRSDDEREEEDEGAGLGGSGVTGGTVRKRISGRRRNNLSEGLDAILQPSRRKEGPPQRSLHQSGPGPAPMGAARKSSIFNLRSRTAAAAVAAASDTYGIAASYGFTASARPASPQRAGPGHTEAIGSSTAAAAALPSISSSAGLPASGSSAPVGPSAAQQAAATAAKPVRAPQSATELEEELLARAAAEEAAKDAAARLIAREQRTAQREQRRKERQGRQAQAAQGIVPARKASASNQSYSTGQRSRGDSAALSGTSLSQSAASMAGHGPTSSAAPDRIHRQRSTARLERSESYRTRSVSTAHPHDSALYISTPARGRPPSFSLSSSVGPGGQGGGNTTPTWTMVTPARRPSGASGDTGRDTHAGAAGQGPNAAGMASAMKLARIRAGAGPAGMSASTANLSARGVGNSARASESSRWEAPPSKQSQPQPARSAPSGGGGGLDQSSAASVALTYGGTEGTTAATTKFKDVKQASALSSSPLPVPPPGPFPGLPAYAFDGTYREDEEQDGPLKANAGIEVHAGQNESAHRQKEAAAAAIHGPNGMDAQPYLPSTTSTDVAQKPPVTVGTDGKVKIDRIASNENVSQSMFITPGVQPASSAQTAATINKMSGLAVALVSRLKLPPGQAALVPAALAVLARTAARRARTTAYLAGVGKANERPLYRGPLGSSPPRLFDYYACVGRGPLLPDVDVMGSRGPEELEYRPDVISRVPKENWRGCVLPNGLGEMVFATGMRLSAGVPVPSSSATSFTQPSPQLLTLVFTNDIGTRLYAACVIVWEPLHADPGEFLDALRHAPSSTGMEGEAFTSGGEESAASGPKAKAAVASKRPVAIPIWLLPAAVGKKLKAPDSPTLDKVWTPKAHILLSRAPVYSAMFAALRQLVGIGSEAACRFAELGAAMSSGASAGDPALRMYRSDALAAGQASVDKAILPIILDVPMPPQGILSIGFTVGSAHIIAARPPPNAPSLADVPLTPLFMCLDASNVLAAIVALLTNQRIVLCSKHTTILPLVAEALMSLLSPFQWVFPYVPLCRLDDPDTLGSPLGITGWPSTMESAQAANAYAVFVDLDNNVCSTFDPLPVIPEAQRKKLLRTLRVHAYGSGGGGLGTDRGTGSGPFLFRQAARTVGDGPAYGADHNPALRRWLAHQTARWADTGFAHGDGRLTSSTPLHDLQLAMIPLAAAGLVINPRDDNATTATSPLASAVSASGNALSAQGSRPVVDKDQDTSKRPPTALPPTKSAALTAAEGAQSAAALPIPSLAPPWYTNTGQYGGHYHGGSVPLSALAQAVHPTPRTGPTSGPIARPETSASHRLSRLCFGWRWESEGHVSKSGAHAKNPAGASAAASGSSGVSSGDEANAVDSDEGMTAVVKRTHNRAVTVTVDVDVPAVAATGSAGSGNTEPTASPRDLSMASPADSNAAGERAPPGTDPLSGLSMSFHAQSIRDGVTRLILSLFKRYGKYTRYHVVGYASASASAAAVHRIIVAHEASKALKGAAASAEPPPLPPLPLPVLRVSFDAQAFLATEYPKTFLPSERTDRNKDARELAAQILRTQMWQTSFLDEGLVPTIYRGVPMPGSVPATPVPWDPAREDPFFQSRLHPTIRRFNALINAKLNRLAGQNTYSIFGTKAAPKLDTSFLEDNSYAITRHVAFPPPLPPGASVPPDVGAALSALASMAAGMVAGTIPAAVGGNAAVASPGQLVQDSMSVDPTLLLSPALGALGTWTGGGGANQARRGGGAIDGRIAAAMASARATQGRRMSRIPLVQGRGSIVSALAFDSAGAGLRGSTGPGLRRDFAGGTAGGSSHWPSAMGGASADGQEYSRSTAQPALARTRAQVAQGRRESSRHLVNVQLATGGGGGSGSLGRPGTATGNGSAQASMFVARQSRSNQS